MKVWNVIVGFILLLASTAVLAPARAEAQGLTLGDYAASLEMPLSAISAPLTELQMEAMQPVPQALYLNQYRNSMRLGSIGRIAGGLGLVVGTTGFFVLAGCAVGGISDGNFEGCGTGLGMMVVGGSAMLFGAVAAPWGVLRAARRLRLMGSSVTVVPGIISAVGSGLMFATAAIPNTTGAAFPAFLVTLIGSAIQAGANRRAFYAGGFDQMASDTPRGAQVSFNPMRVDHGGWGAQMSIVF